MPEVHIVDIDGEQWDMKDMPLTARVEVLESKTVITEDVLWKRGEEYIKIMTINGKRFLSFNFNGVVEASQVVQTQISFGQRLNPSNTLYIMGTGDYKNGIGRVPVSLSFTNTGDFVTVTILPTQATGAINPIRVYGHGFANMD